MPLRAILFDVDGTLAETEELHRETFNRAFAERGLDWQWDEALYRRLLGVTGGKERLAAYAREMGTPMDVATIAAIHARKTALYVEGVDSGALALRPGVAETIRTARQKGIRLGIATTTTRANVDSLLRATLGLGAPDWFEAIVAGDAVAHKKPAPDVYLAALAMLDLAAGECLAIEDSPDGLRAATAAGIATVITPSHYMAGGDFSAAVRIVPTLAALEWDELERLV